MNVISITIPDVKIIEPNVFGDERGFFYESFNARAFREQVGIEQEFVQDNHSKSVKGVLRGLHSTVSLPGRTASMAGNCINHLLIWAK